jgi:hypothetical protein
VFRVELFPAEQGDAIWIEYGEPAAPSRVLIDAGTPPTAARVSERIARLPKDEQRFDLLVVTHVDTDHIGGVLKLLDKRPPYLRFDDVWFNSLRHFPKPEKRSSKLGDIDGTILSRMLDSLGWAWNEKFDGNAIQVPVRGDLPERTLRGGLKLTVLSPEPAQLVRLRDRWQDSILEAGLDLEDPEYPERLRKKARAKGISSSLLGKAGVDIATLAGSRFKPDPAVANGSTIGLLAEYDGRSILLGGDAYAPVMQRAIARLLQKRGGAKLRVNAFKLPHHGSAANVSNELLALVDTERYLFSTSGAVFGHPDDQALGRVIGTRSRGSKTLHFNYTAATLAKNYRKKKARAMPDWSDEALTERFRYTASFPRDDNTGVVLDL